MLVCYWLALSLTVLTIVQAGCPNCERGACVDELCVCDPGWAGKDCSFCAKRTVLSDTKGTLLSNAFPSTGGSYANKTVCSWLINAPTNTTIRLHFNFFKTECSWDHLYVYDGSSPFSPSIAVFGGEFYSLTSNMTPPELVTSANTAFVVFRADAYVNHDGFNISYRVNGCPEGCSEHGSCVSSECNCNEGWRGARCHIRTCQCLNGGSCTSEGLCTCPAQYTGTHCEQSMLHNHWQHIPSQGQAGPGGRASFAGAVVGDKFWIFGGFHLDRSIYNNRMAWLDIPSKKWTGVRDSGPLNREGHTLTSYQDVLYMYGGQINYQISNDFWKFNTSSETWHQVSTDTHRLHSMGHCAVRVGGQIYHLFGIDENYVPILDVQVFNIDGGKWEVIHHRSMKMLHSSNTFSIFERVVFGRYSPVCGINPVNDRIVVFGGLNMTTMTGYGPDYKIYEATFTEYDIKLNSWTNLYKANRNFIPPSYLTAGSIVGRNLVLFGGKNVRKVEGQCYNTQAYLMNLETGESKVLRSVENNTDIGLVRFGHTSFVYNSSVYYFGGFSGVMHDDLIIYHLIPCERMVDERQCLYQREDHTLCQWLNVTGSNGTTGGTCITKPISECGTLQCTTCPAGDSFGKRCVACQNNTECHWDEGFSDTCRAKHIVTQAPSATFNCRNVGSGRKMTCDEYKDCTHCVDDCVWNIKTNTCGVNIQYSQNAVQCDKFVMRCKNYLTCDSCMMSSIGEPKCMWCSLTTLSDELDGSRTGQCVESAAYPVLYPYGQCLQWSMSTSQANLCPAGACSTLGNCTLCQDKPECGWCDDGSGTGSGNCLAGDYFKQFNTTFQCAINKWYYDSCPSCQCNGHSQCTDGKLCDACTGHTIGPNCDKCDEGYYGDATNSGQCRKCECGRHSHRTCNHLSGRCQCDTKGIGGLRCDHCITGNFEGDPVLDTCYQKLEVGKIYHFVITEETKMNFRLRLDETVSEDIKFKLNFTGPNGLPMNITLNITGRNPEVEEYLNIEHGLTVTLKQGRYRWRKESVNVSIYTTFPHTDNEPRDLMVACEKNTLGINLTHFFLIFFGCVVFLLLSVLLIWIAKINYDRYRNRQSLAMELIERATRPFKTHLTLFEDSQPLPGHIFEVQPIAVEPLRDDHYAITTYLIQHPGQKRVNLTFASSAFTSTVAFSKLYSDLNYADR